MLMLHWSTRDLHTQDQNTHNLCIFSPIIPFTIYIMTMALWYSYLTDTSERVSRDKLCLLERWGCVYLFFWADILTLRLQRLFWWRLQMSSLRMTALSFPMGREALKKFFSYLQELGEYQNNNTAKTQLKKPKFVSLLQISQLFKSCVNGY